MKNVKQEALLWVQLGSFVAIWAVILYVSGTGLSINWAAVKKLPDVVTVYVILSFVFSRWLWRLRIFRGWLVPFPNVQGTWEGELKSTWKNPQTGQAVPAIPAILVIRQTFSSVSCTLFTQESVSFSTAAQFSLDEESEALHLNYNYTNRPRATLRDRSTIHDGAARLRIVTMPEKSLEGEFWTSRCTTGDLSMKFKNRELLERFPDSRAA